MKVIPLHLEEKLRIALAVEHNRTAQQQIYAQFSSKMLGVCRQYIKDVQHAEDVMISGFMKVFTQLHTFEHKGSFEGWIRRIMIYECIDFLRVKQNQFNHQDIEDVILVEKDSAYEMEEFSADDIQNLIDQLPDGYKMVFNLYAIEGYKHQEIAELLKISEGTSKSQLYHARKLLQHRIIALKNTLNGTK
ncbi:RNA polymerase sigma factor [Flavobacterium sp.]|jgi:RNA polymerase sigma-70 factor (ECF subfamily)|uniref:RNA polymerase sigma factor n=1 Tax=Flavobacterium sp. TaxID=239 RepID=UPI0037C0B931